MSYIIKQQFIPKGHPARPGIPLNHPTSITIHWIGPYPKQNVGDPLNWWLKGPDGKGIQASAHFIVKDDQIINAIPTAEVAWHAGCQKGNYGSMGIEVIPEDTEGKFSDNTVETLCYIISTLPMLPIIRHYDWTQKDCPRWYTPVIPEGDAHWAVLKAELEGAQHESQSL